MFSPSSSLRRKIIIQERRRETDAEYHSAQDEWVDWPNPLPGNYIPLRGAEYWRGRVVPVPMDDAQAEARIVLRYRKDITSGMHRAVFDGVIYDIVSVQNDREEKETRLLVRAAATQQPDGVLKNG